jgi:hypothetical protein
MQESQMGELKNIHNNSTPTTKAAAQEKRQRAAPTNSYTAIMGHNTLLLALQQRYTLDVH